jgi:hypothetical protein
VELYPSGRAWHRTLGSSSAFATERNLDSQRPKITSARDALPSWALSSQPVAAQLVPSSTRSGLLGNEAVGGSPGGPATVLTVLTQTPAPVYWPLVALHRPIVSRGV